MKRLLLVAALLLLLAGGYYFGGAILKPTQDQLLYIYTLRSGDIDELHGFTPVLAAQMGQLPILHDVTFNEETKSLQSKLGVATSVEKVLPTVTISFRLMPGATLSEAITQISAIEKRLGLPGTIQTALSKARTDR